MSNQPADKPSQQAVDIMAAITERAAAERERRNERNK